MNVRVLIVEPDLSDSGAMRVTLDRGWRWSSTADVRYLITSADTRGRRGNVEMPGEPRMSFGVRNSLPPWLRRRVPYTVRQVATMVVSIWRGLPLARNADVIVAGREVGDGLFVAWALARIARRPLTVTIQSDVGSAIDAYVTPRFQDLTRRVHRHADLAVCVSRGLSPSVEAVGVPPSKIRVVHNGIDGHGVQAAAQEAPSIALPDGRFIVSSGRLCHQKGFDVAIRAHAAALAAGAPTHSLVIVGEGEDRAELETLAAELKVTDSVLLPGFVRNPHALVARADAFFMTSRWEGLPLVLVEALAVGAPIIAADCVSGPSEILEEGRFGALAPVEDVAALTAALTAHLLSPDELRDKATAGTASVALRFDPARAADLHLALLRDVASARVPRRGARRPGAIRRRA